MVSKLNNVFDNYFDVENSDISELRLTKSADELHCYLEDKQNFYGGFIISNKPRVETRCKILFIKSKSTGKFKPIIEFRKVTKKGELRTTNNDVIIGIKDSNELENFWKIISFLQGFTELIETGEFSKYYKAVSHESYKIYFEKEEQSKKISAILDLIDKTDLSEDLLKSILYNQRKKIVKGFYYLLKNIDLNNEEKSIDFYKKKHEINELGEEAVWHHFLKNNNWILGLNTDLRFIYDLLSEQKLGREDSKAKGSSKTDLLGLSYFTTIIELKTPSTPIFKENKTSKSRANTFDFSNDFIESYSQILAQHWDISSNPDKNLRDENENILDRHTIRTIDPKAVLIIGSRNYEFPHNRTSENLLKTDSFERIRRDSKKVDIITYDELFERAFNIVSVEKLPINWYSINEQDFIKNYL